MFVADMNTVVIDDDKKMNMILDKAPPCLKRLVYIREIRKETLSRASSMGIEAIRFDQVEKIGSAHKNSYPEMVSFPPRIRMWDEASAFCNQIFSFSVQPPRPDDICTVCYTSGTTGNPKGVMLSHENVIADVSAVMLQLGEHRPNRHDVMISFLPLAHMFERCCQVRNCEAFKYLHVYSSPRGRQSSSCS